MIPIVLNLIFLCFLSQTYSIPQVVPWGFQRSIGKSPFNPPWYDVQNVTDGVYAADDYYTWPNKTVPYELDTNPANFGGNITLRKIVSTIHCYNVDSLIFICINNSKPKYSNYSSSFPNYNEYYLHSLCSSHKRN